MAYSEPPLRNIVRLIVTSAYSIGSAPSALSMVRTTSARPSGGRPEVPAPQVVLVPGFRSRRLWPRQRLLPPSRYQPRPGLAVRRPRTACASSLTGAIMHC